VSLSKCECVFAFKAEVEVKLHLSVCNFVRTAKSNHSPLSYANLSVAAKHVPTAKESVMARMLRGMMQ
jgi:hypothetical protein